MHTHARTHAHTHTHTHTQCTSSNRAFRSDSYVHVCLRRLFSCITSDIKHCSYEVSHFILHSQTTNKPLFYMRQLGSGNRREDTSTPLSNPSSGHSFLALSFISLSPYSWRRAWNFLPVSCSIVLSAYFSEPLWGARWGIVTTIPRIPRWKLFHRGSMIAQDDTQEIYPRDMAI